MPHKRSSLEKKFCAVWKHIDGPELEEELRFHPERRWRADFAHSDSMTLIEVEGGIHIQGRHNRASGFIKDAEKYLEATLLGWRVIRLVDNQLNVQTLSRIANSLSKWTDPDRYQDDTESEMLDLL
jgi:very-short-patch-repair endonuclease